MKSNGTHNSGLSMATSSSEILKVKMLTTCQVKACYVKIQNDFLLNKNNVLHQN